MNSLKNGLSRAQYERIKRSVTQEVTHNFKKNVKGILIDQTTECEINEDAALLYILHTHDYGGGKFGIKRLREIYRDFLAARVEAREQFCDDVDIGDYAIRRALLDDGIDVQAWHDEFTHIETEIMLDGQVIGKC